MIDLKKLGIGFCLGDSFDINSYYFETDHIDTDNWETQWGNPKITNDLIKLIKSKGFQTIKIPVTWNEHLLKDDNGDYYIEEWFITRLKEIIDIVLDNNMYCIINMQHDRDWIQSKILPDGTKLSYIDILTIYTNIWSLAVKAFKSYSDKLLYESMNEVGFNIRNDYYPGSDLYYNLNNAFISIVKELDRKDRTIIINGIYADPIETYKSLEVDRLEKYDNLLLSLHFYQPLKFTLSFVKGTTEDKSHEYVMNHVNTVLNKIDEARKLFGINIIISEMGCNIMNKDASNVLEWYKTVIDFCAQNCIPIMIWNDGKEVKEAILRDTMEDNLPGILDVISSAAKVMDESKNIQDEISAIEYDSSRTIIDKPVYIDKEKGIIEPQMEVK